MLMSVYIRSRQIEGRRRPFGPEMSSECRDLISGRIKLLDDIDTIHLGNRFNITKDALLRIF